MAPFIASAIIRGLISRQFSYIMLAGQLFKEDEDIHGIITAVALIFNFYVMNNYQCFLEIGLNSYILIHPELLVLKKKLLMVNKAKSSIEFLFSCHCVHAQSCMTLCNPLNCSGL